jgi:cysteine synthase A
MIEAAEKSGDLQPGGTIVEPTSGNTGVGLAMVAAVKGYKLILIMPESMSLERRRLMLAYGATFDLTPREKGMKGAIERALEIIDSTPGAWMPQQFENPANIAVHTAPRRRRSSTISAMRRSMIITGVGTGGHITGTAERAEEGLAQPPGLSRSSPSFVAGHFGRPARPSPDPGHRRGLHAANLHTGIRSTA